MNVCGFINHNCDPPLLIHTPPHASCKDITKSNNLKTLALSVVEGSAESSADILVWC